MENKKNNNNNSSNSLVFGRWPQTKIELNFCDFKAYNYVCNRGVLGFESRPGKAFSQQMIRHSLNRMQHKINILYLMRLLVDSKQLFLTQLSIFGNISHLF